MTTSNDNIKLPLTIEIERTETPEQLTHRAAEVFKQVILQQPTGEPLTYEITVDTNSVSVSAGKSETQLHRLSLIRYFLGGFVGAASLDIIRYIF